MSYLDYSATTPLDMEVLEAFNKANIELYGNPNSNHKLGVLASQLVDDTTSIVNQTLNAKNFEVIYTSGATESNNLAIKGYCLANKDKGKHIITSPYEHSSVTSCLNYLATLGFEIDVLGTDKFGNIDLLELEELIQDDTILVSIATINSELGIKQDIKKINEIVRKHPKVVFHSDMTQAIGKVKVDVNQCDLVSFSAHKIYGIKGVGSLLRKEHINLTPVIHGGKSTSIFRGGTPAAPLIYSLGIALKKAYTNFDSKLNHIQKLYDYLVNGLLKEIENAHINYTSGIPQIINVSFVGLNANKLQQTLSNQKIYISTQTACNSESSFSNTVKRLTGRDDLAKSSVRISISHLTEKEELDQLVEAVKVIIHENN